jgi:hypothetical protein
LKANGDTGSAHMKRQETVARHGTAKADSPPDRAHLREEAQALIAHPSFDETMRTFRRNLTDFHAPENAAKVEMQDQNGDRPCDRVDDADATRCADFLVELRGLCAGRSAGSNRCKSDAMKE